MPELPEAQTIAAALDAEISGAVITRARLGRKDYIKNAPPSAMRKLAGRTIAGVTRRGKCPIIEIPPLRLVLQLGLAGRVYIHPPERQPPPHTHLTLALADGREVRYANVRRIASGVHLLADGDEGLLSGLGPDADAIECEEFIARLAGRSTQIKSALLNQSILAGVGNIYADESLFRVGIRPTRRVNRISRAKLAELHRAVRDVLAEAIAVGGSTVSKSTPFAAVNGRWGQFTTSHQAYGRYGQPCLKCGRTLRRTTVGGRTTTYCSHCQR